MKTASKCPNCTGEKLYALARTTEAGGAYGPWLLPGLGPLLSSARMQVVVCRECGPIRFFADEEATAKLLGSRDWIPLGSTSE